MLTYGEKQEWQTNRKGLGWNEYSTSESIEKIELIHNVEMGMQIQITYMKFNLNGKYTYVYRDSRCCITYYEE